MDSFRVIIPREFEREFKAVPFPFRRQLNQRILKLRHDPYPPDAEPLPDESFRLSAYGWKLLYGIDRLAGTVTLYSIRKE